MKGRLRALVPGSSLERASWLRHVALALALGAIWLMRQDLTLSNQVLWILGSAATLNFATTLLFQRPAWTPTARTLSSAFGVSAWAALAFINGGARSPFVAGLWLEIVFSAVVFPPVGTLVVTAAACVALWIQEALLGPGVQGERLWLQTGFVAVVGVVTFFASKRWTQADRALSLRAVALDRRLATLEGELDTARHLVTLGEGVARIAHGLKNAVHSLRGFTKLLESQCPNAHSRDQAIAGLHLAINRLEEIAQTTLHPPRAAASATAPWTSAPEVERTLDEVLEEVGRRYHGVQWIRASGERGLQGVTLSRSQLREVLLVLVENAAEASGAAGEVVVNANTDRGMFNLLVRDRGPGISPQLADRLFDLGATTKATGNGLGLFLARRLVEARGGRLTAAPATGGGALFSVTIPLPKA